jgi:phage-related baseplate assembly protein
VTDFVHEAAIELADGADPRAPGGAITVALCGHWDHEPPCRWPHHTDVTPDGDRHLVRTAFTAAPEEEGAVRERIVQALESGRQAGPDGQVSRWTARPRR